MGQKQSRQRLTVFHNAVRNGNVERVKEMLTEGISLEDQDDVFGMSMIITRFTPNTFISSTLVH